MCCLTRPRERSHSFHSGASITCSNGVLDKLSLVLLSYRSTSNVLFLHSLWRPPPFKIVLYNIDYRLLCLCFWVRYRRHLSYFQGFLDSKFVFASAAFCYSVFQKID